MKKIILIITVLCCIALAFAGCSKKPADVSTEENNKLKVVTTIFAAYDFTNQITKGNADIALLLPPGTEAHSYEPSPQDIIKIQNCDVFIYNGGESEEWVDDILENIDNPEIKVIKMMDSVNVLEEEVVEGMDAEHEHDHDADAHDEDNMDAHDDGNADTHDDDNADTHDKENHDNNDIEEHSEDEHDTEFDEHIWTSPKNAIKIVKSISQAICEKDSEHKAEYEKNTSQYLSQLEELDKQFEAVVANGNRKTVIFGDRFPLRYFVDAYNLQYFAAFPGCSTDTEPSAATVAFLINKVKEEKIPVVFCIELSNGKMADTICEATGAKKLTFNACHNISKDDFKKGVTYLDMMKANVSSLEEALK